MPSTLGQGDHLAKIIFHSQQVRAGGVVKMLMFMVMVMVVMVVVEMMVVFVVMMVALEMMIMMTSA